MDSSDNKTSDHHDPSSWYASARWLKPRSTVEKMVMQSARPEESAFRWEVFRELPKPASWAEAERIAGEPQAPLEWEGVQASAVLDLNDLVSRPCVPDHQDQPRPLRQWRRDWHSRTFSRPEAEVDDLQLRIEPFSHAPLRDDDEIRVLELFPGEGLDALQFRLRPVRLDGPDVAYDALSYSWGVRMVDCRHEDRLVTFPESLYRALLRFRHPTQARVLWADALCINQEDEREKSRQVRLMRRVFRRARRVLIWLGDDDAHVAQPAFDLARRMRAVRHREQPDAAPPPESPVWGALVRLFDCAWFGRSWCLQEVVLARSAEVVWGPHAAPWEDVGFTAGWVCNVGYAVLASWMGRVYPSWEADEGSDYHPGVYRASLMYSLWSSGRTTPPAEPMSFFDLLCLTRPFEATDHRDKVFSLIGIPTTDADPDLGQCFLEPDYSRTVDEVFVEVAKRLATQKPGSLDFLGAVQTKQYHIWGEPEVDIPSWVPDWSVFNSRSLMPITVPGEKRVSASSRLPVAEVAFDRSALLVSGVQADTVRGRESLPSRGSFSWLVKDLSGAWKTLVEPLETYPGGTSLPEAFCWTISGGNTWDGRRVTADERARHIADYEAFRAKYCVREDEYFPPVERHSETTARTGAHEQEPDAHRFYEALCHACSNRSFFVTKKGYIGMGPGYTPKDSRVCILSGAELPFVLREQSQDWPDTETEQDSDPSFTVLGECYVHGMMDGDTNCALTSIDVGLLRLV